MKKLLIVFLVLFVSSAQAQNFKLNSNQTQLRVEGTSTLHDWEMQATDFESTAKIILENGQLREIKSLTFKVPVRSLKSGTSGMDQDAYEALKAEEHPLVIYEFVSIESERQSGSKVILETRGQLTMAGETRIIKMQVTADISATEIIFEGSVSFKMTEFGVEPPTALFGTLKAGNKVTINFRATYLPK